jgi:hypothetical protein
VLLTSSPFQSRDFSANPSFLAFEYISTTLARMTHWRIRRTRTDSCCHRRRCKVTRRTPQGPKCIPVQRVRRRVLFLTQKHPLIERLPLVQLDPCLERYVFRCRTRTKFCPQFRRYMGNTVSLPLLKVGAMRGCALCVLGYFVITTFYTSKIRSSRLLSSTFTYDSTDHSALGLSKKFELYTTTGELRRRQNCSRNG